MESSPRSRAGDIASDIFIILVTATQLIFFTFFHQYIAWYTTEPDGSVARLSMLTDDYFTWLPFPIIASILVIVATTVTIIWNNDWFRQTAQVGFSLIGIVVTVSLVAIFPFDFSVIPKATAVDVVPKVVTAILILMAVFYATTALVLFVRLRRYTAKKEPR